MRHLVSKDFLSFSLLDPTLYSFPSPELKEQPSYMLIWSCYSSSPTSGSREVLILCYPPLFISMFRTSYTGSFHVAHSPKQQRTSECKRAHSCLWAHSPGAAIPSYHHSSHALQASRRKHGGPLRFSSQGSPASLLSFLQFDTAQRKS